MENAFKASVVCMLVNRLPGIQNRICHPSVLRCWAAHARFPYLCRVKYMEPGGWSLQGWVFLPQPLPRLSFITPIWSAFVKQRGNIFQVAALPGIVPAGFVHKGQVFHDHHLCCTGAGRPFYPGSHTHRHGSGRALWAVWTGTSSVWVTGFSAPAPIKRGWCFAADQGCCKKACRIWK